MTEAVRDLNGFCFLRVRLFEEEPSVTRELPWPEVTRMFALRFS